MGISILFLMSFLLLRLHSRYRTAIYEIEVRKNRYMLANSKVLYREPDPDLRRGETNIGDKG